MSHITDNISYIIGYRESTAERKEALVFVLRWLRRYFPNMEILIVEQDKSPTLSLNKSLNARQIFCFNDGLYNRCWSFNVAAKHTEKNIFVFSDSDVVLSRENYMECFNAIQHFDTITPNKENAVNIEIDNKETFGFSIIEERLLDTFASMFMVMTRNGFKKIGGWDERFEGWGAEDNAISHIIFNKLASKTFKFPVYHIKHPRSILDGNQQPKYEANWKLSQEIETLNGRALDRYIQKTKGLGFGDIDKYQKPKNEASSTTLRFVLAITTYNRLAYLKSCLGSFWKTRSNNSVSWHIVVADDGSDDGTTEYLEELAQHHDLFIIKNDRSDIAHQTNTILKYLSNCDFDLCFKSDDDVVFLKEGWDFLYWNVIERIGYQHLIFYDESWNPAFNLDDYIIKGRLISRCDPYRLQGAFFTLTKELINKVGYIDEQRFKTRGYEHVDYSLRCCRAGFNVPSSPFDVADSNDYIGLQSRQTYLRSLPESFEPYVNTLTILKYKREIIRANRIYVPYNENYENIEAQIKQAMLANPSSLGPGSNGLFPKQTTKKPKLKKADPVLYTDRGISGVIGFVLKRIYNTSIDLKLYIIARSFKTVGKTLNKISNDLMNIDQ